MDHVDACIVGAGVVGLAVGRALAMEGLETLVLDQESRYGEGVSSRNSEVIHAGIYYPKNSLKAELCVKGKHLLYEYCEQRSIRYERLGKLIVATSQDEEADLDQILEKARGNGVDDLTFVSSTQLSKEEPAVKASLALLSPSTGIVNSHDLMTALLGDLESAGGSLVVNTEFNAAKKETDKFVIDCDVGGETYRFSSRLLINSAGLGAQKVAHSIVDVSDTDVPPLYLCKGNYFLLQGKCPFNHLIYPVPEKSGAGLGVHATIDTGGQVKFGPDVEYISSEDYHVSDERLDAAYKSIRRYFPSLEDDHLIKGYAGIRPKLQGPDDEPKDFVVQDETEHGVQGLVQLFGIESPGLTSSMAIAETVCNRFKTLQS